MDVGTVHPYRRRGAFTPVFFIFRRNIPRITIRRISSLSATRSTGVNGAGGSGLYRPIGFTIGIGTTPSTD